MDIQLSGIFEDSKTFVDSDPIKEPKLILSDYRAFRDNSSFDIGSFVRENFNIPEEKTTDSIRINEDLDAHLNVLWGQLLRDADKKDGPSTLISLPNEYIVPGGRFREIYYWDSYFTMIGLGVSNRVEIIESMVDNFAHLINEIGYVPNGNRTYYIGRSQPPYFSMMVNLLWQYTDDETALKYLTAIQREYDFWMDGSDNVSDSLVAFRRVVKFNGALLNRYWDDFDTPRPESFKEDIELAHGLTDFDKKKLYRNLRAAAESGWDFSARWFANPDEFSSIRTTEILPLDLNCLTYTMEVMLSRLYQINEQEDLSRHYLKQAENRYNAINDLFWDESRGIYNDIIWTENQLSPYITAASFYPMYLKVARQDFADLQVPTLVEELLIPGGISTSTIESAQQWDMPNGWAPLQWIAVKGLEHYGFGDLSSDIADRWLKVNTKVYRNTGKMMEKYNVSDTTLLAGGGEYPTQDGFGWTNGVFLGLSDKRAKY